MPTPVPGQEPTVPVFAIGAQGMDAFAESKAQVAGRRVRIGWVETPEGEEVSLEAAAQEVLDDPCLS